MIALIVTLQILYVIYTDGKSMGLDVLASMGLVAAIGLGVIFAMQIFAPTKPLPKSRPSIFNEGDAKSAVASTSTDKPTDELEQIAASVAPNNGTLRQPLIKPQPMTMTHKHLLLFC